MQQQPVVLAAAREALAVLCTVPGTDEVIAARNHLRFAIEILEDDEDTHAAQDDPIR